jgi:hypothetical protein
MLAKEGKTGGLGIGTLIGPKEPTGQVSMIAVAADTTESASAAVAEATDDVRLEDDEESEGMMGEVEVKVMNEQEERVLQLARVGGDKQRSVTGGWAEPGLELGPEPAASPPLPPPLPPPPPQQQQQQGEVDGRWTGGGLSRVPPTPEDVAADAMAEVALALAMEDAAAGPSTRPLFSLT